MSAPQALSNASKCACGSTRKYIKCCGLYIKKGVLVPTAEVLMRSRYTAYVLNDKKYLLNSWHSSTRPSESDLEDDDVEWASLVVLDTSGGTSSDNDGTVEFIAYYKRHGKSHNKKQQIHEVSRFVKEDNQWFYIDGLIK